jgi:hypothetical protein
MGTVYDALKVLHILSFVFMSIPLFNLIVVNERALMGGAFVYATDRYMENLIRHGATRCFVFQASVLVTGLSLLVVGPLGIGALWHNWVLLTKALLLLLLMIFLSYVHVGLQPKTETYLATISPDGPAPENVAASLKPYRVRRKRLATLCLFIVLVTIILGVQVYGTFAPGLNLILIGSAALFSWRANRTLMRFGWI